jgi:hypothetical protein
MFIYYSRIATKEKHPYFLVIISQLTTLHTSALIPPYIVNSYIVCSCSNA